MPDNFRLLSLPPYSPELNPMENVWDYLRQNKLCPLVWDTYDDILESCETAWNFLIDDPGRIRSVGLALRPPVSLLRRSFVSLIEQGRGCQDQTMRRGDRSGGGSGTGGRPGAKDAAMAGQAGLIGH